MTLMKHELRQGRISLAVWTGAIVVLLLICLLVFPEMKGEMETISHLFAAMGSFAAAFGMDRLNFGSLTGFYAIECGNVIGLGGAFFAAFAGVSILSKEEGEGTAEFLLAHPVSRARVVTEKLAAVLLQIAAMNLIVFVTSLLSICAIGEAIPWRELLLMHFACFLLQIELAAVCFGISAFLRRGGLGVGLGIATVMYFLNLIANMSERLKFLKYITPFGYCEGTDIIANGGLDVRLVMIGMLFAALGVAAAYRNYCCKDIL